MKYVALIVDDEPLARRSIHKHLKAFPEFEVAGECGDGESAVAAIREQKPDLVFLDIQLPEFDGFDVICAVGKHAMPVTIFVTAYDRYALQAFEAHALDYLLKPFSEDRFRDGLLRARRTLQMGKQQAPNHQLSQLLDEINKKKDYLERIPVPAKGRFLFFNVRDLDWIEAEGNYLRLHGNGGSHLIRSNMNEMEAKLDPGKFMRIHRSTIVNVQRIREIQPWFHGHHRVVMTTGQELKLSRYQKDKLRQLLGKEN
ncbi:MAG TPA: LytTR family DNA-binding domain-containing protein [Candidatus Angelobacter sp.]|nr:LytTR family DNA-binding domain-containing protein [Candidatus Angelobacter sp.]